MNAQTVQLLRILSACRPDDEELARESRIGRIMQSEDYQALMHRQAFAGLMQDHFTEAKLRTYTAEQLDRVEKALPILSDCLDNLLFSLKNGDCPSLTSADRPDFTDPEALAALRDRLEEGTGKNYCNIPDKDFLHVFDDATVKSLQPYFLELPQPCEDYDAAIRSVLAGKRYSSAPLRSNPSKRRIAERRTPACGSSGRSARSASSSASARRSSAFLPSCCRLWRLR